MKNPLSNLFGRQKAAREAAQSSAVQGPRAGVSGILSLSGWQALQISTVYCCVNAITNTIATLPLQYLKKNTSGIYAPETGRMAYIVGAQPNEDYNWSDFIAQAVRQMLMCPGETVILPVWSTMEIGELAALILCSPGSVAYESMTRRYLINDPENGISGTYDESEVIHLKNLSIDGKHSCSVLSFARTTLDIASTGDAETLSRFANGGAVRGFLGNDTSVKGFGEYADSELHKSAENIDERFRNGERIVNLPGQAQWTPISMSSVDLEFLQSRKFSVREICRFFGVPPTYVFDDTSNNYKSAEMASIAFLSQTINPLLVKIEQEFGRKMISPSRYGKYRFEFDRRGLYTTDLLTKADYQTKTIQSGVYSINDWRRYENQPAVEGGDEVLVSANMKSLGELINPTSTTPSGNGQEE